MRFTRFVSYFLLIILWGSFLLAAEDFALAYSGKLCRGLLIAGVPVGGESVGEAERKVVASLSDQQSRPIATLYLDGAKWEVGWDAVLNRPDPSALVRQAYGVGRTGNILQRILEQFVTGNGGGNVPLGLEADNEKIRSILSAVANTVNREAIDAVLTEGASGLLVKDDISGRKTDVDSMLREVSGILKSGRPTEIPLRVRELPATLRAKDLQGFNAVLSAFATTYEVSDENRSHNIQQASSKMSGAFVRRGEVFSFNDRVGLRTPEQGYKVAPTLSDAGMLMDWGGGVCQVSSTLYVAALLADLSIVERSAHYQQPSYVPLGQDATVADGQIDLKVKNNRMHSVYFRSLAEGGKLEVRIYGKREKDEPSVHLESAGKKVPVPSTLILQDPTLPLGEERIESPGRNGFVVVVQRVRLQGPKEISRETISSDEYEGTARVVRIGTFTADGSALK